MIDRVRALVAEYEDLQRELADSSVYADQRRARDLSRDAKRLERVVNAYNRWQEITADRDAAKELLTDASGEDRTFLMASVEDGDERLRAIEDELSVYLLPADPNEDRNVILEIRGAEGGEEANLFAKDLAEMFQRYAATIGCKVEVMSATPSAMGGYDDCVLLIKGEGAWSHFKFEGGVHRVQRVPMTESQGRIHTSSSTVMVLPEAEEVDVDLDPNELRIDVFRASGPGGQSVNTTDSAVRITHVPTGIVVSMQDEKSQLQNRDKAMRVLRARLLQAAQDEQERERSIARKGQVGAGGRSEKIRTYNFKDNRVTDHRIGLTLYKLDRVLSGELDDLVDALTLDERARLLDAELD